MKATLLILIEVEKQDSPSPNRFGAQTKKERKAKRLSSPVKIKNDSVGGFT
jgi:hypothetical protein